MTRVPVAPGMPMGKGAEFDAIRKLLHVWGQRAEGIGDDAATLALTPGTQLVASVDASVEGVHFRPDWLTDEEIGWRAAAAALSDLAAMAARPVGVLVALALPHEWRERLEGIAEGIGLACAGAGAPIVGGNMSGAERLSLTLTVLGEAERPLHRRGARVGDAVYVTGALGAPGAALAAWESGVAPAAAHRARFAHPVPRLAEARWLAGEGGASAAIDISDGLLADAGHLAAASGVRIAIEGGLVPLAAGVARERAFASGEEYELLVAAPPRLDAREFADRFGIPLTRIGEVVAGAAGVVLRGDAVGDAAGAAASVANAGGHDHFSG